MDILVEILKVAAGILAGGGLSWLMYPKLKRQKFRNDMMEEESNMLEDVMKRATAQHKQLLGMLSKNVELENQVADLSHHNENLRQELETERSKRDNIKSCN